MGYCMHMREAVFFLQEGREPEALAAIKSLAGQETIEDGSGMHFSWVDTSAFLGAITLREGMSAWRWGWDGEELYFTGEKLGDDFILFQAIAPCVRAGSYIEMQGEDGTIWRWVFNGQTCEEKVGKVVFE